MSKQRIMLAYVQGLSKAVRRRALREALEAHLQPKDAPAPAPAAPQPPPAPKAK